MAREYFPHDFYARSELRDIYMKFGMEGIGFYWCLVEILHESGGSIKESELKAISYELRVSDELCNHIVRDFGLFTVKKGRLSSDRVLKNLKKRAEISEARKKAAESRWGSGDNGQSYRSEDAASEELQALLKQLHIKYCSGTIDEWKLYFEKQFSEWTNSIDFHNREFGVVCTVQEIFNNLIDELRDKKYVVINRKKVCVNVFLNVMQFFFCSSNGHDIMLRVWESVEEKYTSGGIKNKQNYLISALFNAAKMNGG